MFQLVLINTVCSIYSYRMLVSVGRHRKNHSCVHKCIYNSYNNCSQNSQNTPCYKLFDHLRGDFLLTLHDNQCHNVQNYSCNMNPNSNSTEMALYTLLQTCTSQRLFYCHNYIFQFFRVFFSSNHLTFCNESILVYWYLQNNIHI